MALSITIFSIRTLNITTLSIANKKYPTQLYDTQHIDTQYGKKCHTRIKDLASQNSVQMTLSIK